MKTAVLAFSGATRSGKTSLSIAVASLLGWHRVSFGEYVRSVARSRGLPDTREQLQALGESLISDDLRGCCSAVLGQAPWRQGHSLVIDGVRHLEALDCLRMLVAPIPLYLIHIAIDQPTRSSRTNLADVAFDLSELDRHTTESQVVSVLPQRADRIVDGSRDLFELASELAAWAASL